MPLPLSSASPETIALSAAARRLRISESQTRRLIDQGQLAALRGPYGRAPFREAVERLAIARQAEAGDGRR
jgi:hypothetical protein